jgi:hypothetical protein
MSETTTNRYGWTFTKGFAIPPVIDVPTDTRHEFEPATDEPQHVRDRKPFHADRAKVMETLIEPTSPTFAYQPGMYVYVHQGAYNTNPLDAQECLITDVDNAPLAIVVAPCNHPEQAFEVRQDQLSAPIYV